MVAAQTQTYGDGGCQTAYGDRVWQSPVARGVIHALIRSNFYADLAGRETPKPNAFYFPGVTNKELQAEMQRLSEAGLLDSVRFGIANEQYWCLQGESHRVDGGVEFEPNTGLRKDLGTILAEYRERRAYIRISLDLSPLFENHLF